MKLTDLCCALFLVLAIAGCGGDDGSGGTDGTSNDSTNNGADNNVPPAESCKFNGQISGDLNYVVSHDITDGCGGASTANHELITSFGGIGSEPNIKIYHENFEPGLATENRSAFIVIHKGVDDSREWKTATGACTINMTPNQYDISSGEVKISGSGSCASPALPDTNTGATNNIVIGPFTFESTWLNWP